MQSKCNIKLRIENMIYIKRLDVNTTAQAKVKKSEAKVSVSYTWWIRATHAMCKWSAARVWLIPAIANWSRIYNKFHIAYELGCSFSGFTSEPYSSNEIKVMNEVIMLNRIMCAAGTQNGAYLAIGRLKICKFSMRRYCLRRESLLD